MSGWTDSNRRGRLPANWPAIREKVLERDGRRCTWRYTDGSRCKEPATDVDHRRRGDNHSMANLRSLCGWHHDKKSAREGAYEAAKQRAEIATRFRRTEAHPNA